MPISVLRPVPETFPITGEYLQTDDIWTPERPHLGVDFGCPTGTLIVSATTPGVVHAVHVPGDGWGDGSFGINVVVDVLGGPWYYLYAHLSEALVRPGQPVSPGNEIGRSGATGSVTGPSLHVQASTSPDFPRDIATSGDPLLGLRGGTPPPGAPSLENRVAAVEQALRAIARELSAL